MAERLYELAREFAGLTGEESVYDLYCGIGTIGLTLARDALTVWGVEVSEESVACAIENAELNGIANAAFFAGEVGEALDDLRERAGAPGRGRRRPAARGALGQGAAPARAPGAGPRIVYVSCNPTTLAGNVKELDGGVGLPARAGTARGHVPAHAAHRDGRAARARLAALALGAQRPPGVLRAQLAPEQVGVRREEAEGEKRQRGQSRDVAMDDARKRGGEGERRSEGEASSQPT